MPCQSSSYQRSKSIVCRPSPQIPGSSDSYSNRGRGDKDRRSLRSHCRCSCCWVRPTRNCTGSKLDLSSTRRLGRRTVARKGPRHGWEDTRIRWCLHPTLMRKGSKLHQSSTCRLGRGTSLRPRSRQLLEHKLQTGSRSEVAWGLDCTSGKVLSATEEEENWNGWCYRVWSCVLCEIHVLLVGIKMSHMSKQPGANQCASSRRESDSSTTVKIHRWQSHTSCRMIVQQQ
jgi:hypothetical protein